MVKLKSSSLSAIFLFSFSIMAFPLGCYFFLNEYVVLFEWDILKVSSCSLSFDLVLDNIGLSFSALVCFISGCVMVFSSSYMSHEPFLQRFIWLVMLFVLSMNFLIYIPSLPALLLGWDGLGIVSFLLVVYYQNAKSLAAGLLTLLANRIGDVMILFSIGILVLQGHWVVLLMWDFHLSCWFVFMISVAAMTKSAQIPFSAWLPAAMAAPTPVSALVHSSTLVTAGVFLIIRFHYFLNSLAGFSTCLLVVSVSTLLMAGLAANFENDLKKIIALSTLSQLGVMMMSLSLGMIYLSLFHLFTHAMFKALLFLCAGMIIHNSMNVQDLRGMGLFFSQAPLTVTCMNIANLALCGAPFLSGFYSKDLILEKSLASSTNMWLVGLSFVATGMTAAYSLRLALCALWSPIKGVSFHSKHEQDIYINSAVSALAIGAIFGGFMMQAWFSSFNEFSFFMPISYKLLTICVLSLGVLCSMFIWSLEFEVPEKAPSKTKYFMSTMWFLNQISSQPLSKVVVLSGTSLMKSVDQGWLEHAGGQKLFLSIKFFSELNAWVQSRAFNFFLASMIGMVVGLIGLATIFYLGR